MNEADLLKRITVNPKIFGGKPIVRACLAYARRVVGHERIEPVITDEAA